MTDRRAVIIGLDARQRRVADELMADGRLPNLAQLVNEGHVADMVNPYGFLTGPVWPTIMTGTSMIKHRNWTWRQLVPGTYRKRLEGQNAGTAVPPLWVPLSEEGVRCSVIDVPRFPLHPETNGEHVVAFRQHDSPGPELFAASPPKVARLIEREFSIFHDRCDVHRSAGAYTELWKELCEGIDQKVALLDQLWADAEPELGIVVFPESHCAGHQFWQRRANEDESPAQPRPDAPPVDLLADIYERLDSAIGEILTRHTDPDTTVVVIMSHGMGTIRPLSRLLNPVLDSIDDEMGRAGVGRRARAFIERLPNRLARAGLRRIGRDIEPLDHWVDSSRRFFPISVFPTFGAVRLNLIGREPRGLISPDERDTVLEHLEQELLALRDIETGEPLVERVDRIEAHHNSETDIGLPDVIFEWRVSDRPILGAVSPSLGQVTASPERYRPGNHLRDGRVIVAGPSVPAGRGSAVRAEDVAPTVAALLGHVLSGCEGRPFLPDDAITHTRP